MKAGLRTLFELLASSGSPTCQLDTDQDPLGGGVLQLSGLDVRREETILLGAAASEQVVAFTEVVAVVLLSDHPFGLKRAAGETAWTNLRHFVAWADDTADGVATTSFVLDGNGVNQATIHVILIAKPS